MKKTLILLLITICIACNTTKKEETTAQYTKTTQQSPLEKSIQAGAVVYKDFCNQCHRANGKGIGKSFPTLAGSNWLTDKRTESIHAVKYGLKGEIEVNGKVYDGIMAPQGLDDQEVVDVLNYVMNSWGNTQEKMVTLEEVKAIKE